MEFFKNIIAEKLSRANEAVTVEAILESFDKPKNPEFGDLALPCFKFAKSLRNAPVKIAEGFREILADDENFTEITNVNGFLNFKVNRKIFVKQSIENLESGQMFNKLKEEGKGKKAIIEYSSLNIAKEPHIGHLRSTGIGNALYKIYKEMGWDVVRINYLGDWGTQFGKLIYAYKSWGDEKELAEKPVRYLMNLYVKFHNEAEKKPELNELGRECFKKLEDKEQEYIELWELFRKYTIQEGERTYDRLNIKFDSYKGEGYYDEHCKDVISEVKNSSISKISEGALIVDLEKYKMPPCLIQKSDGTSIYATRDIAAAKERYEEHKFDKMLYVVGMTQSLHFKQFFKVLELLGYDFVSKCEHISFGQILGFSSRKGNAPYLNEIFDDAKAKAAEVIEEKNPALENKDEIAEKIGVGAVVFYDLSKSRIKDSEFNWENVVSFEGETGPYVQYAAVRMINILEKAGIKESELKSDNLDYELFTDESSYQLINLLANYPEKLKNAFTEAEPSVISNYLIDIAKAFNRFYKNNRVISDNQESTKARLLLVKVAKDLFTRCMDIIGVPIIEKM